MGSLEIYAKLVGPHSAVTVILERTSGSVLISKEYANCRFLWGKKKCSLRLG